MKKYNFIAGQVYASKNERFKPIRIMTIIEGYIVYGYEKGHPFIVTQADITDLLKACKYEVKPLDFDYNGFIVVWDDDTFVIPQPIGTCTETAIGAKAIIDYWNKNHII